MPNIDNKTKIDELLVVRCQLGEPAAFDDLITRWHGPLWAFVRRLAGNDDAAGEILQDVWVRVLRGIPRLRDGSKLRAWLFGIARRTLMDRLRDQYAKAPALDVDVEEIAAETSVDEVDDLAALENAVEGLPLVERSHNAVLPGRTLTQRDRRDAGRTCRDREIPPASRQAAASTSHPRTRLTNMRHPVPPPAVVQELRELTATELSLPSRLRYVCLLLIASTMTAIVIALLLTEPALPARTSIALAALTVIGASWVIFAAWVLTGRRVLLDSHRIVAGRLAVTFCSVFMIGALSLGFAMSSAAAFAAAAMGTAMLAVAIVLLVRARRRFATLSKRRAELERAAEGRLS